MSNLTSTNENVNNEAVNIKELVKGHLYVGTFTPAEAVEYTADVVQALVENGHEDAANARFTYTMWDEMEAAGRVPAVSKYSA